MQIIFKLKKGYVTIFITLVFTIILSLVLLLIEGVQKNSTRLEAKMVAELGIDSCLAEYNRNLWDKFDVLYIDDSYGTNKGSVSKLEKHLAGFVEKNCKQELLGRTSLLRLSNPYLEVEEAVFATDDYGKVWKQQAVNYMKTTYGLEVFENVISQVSNIEGQDVYITDTTIATDVDNEEIKNVTRQKEEELQRKLDEEREQNIEAAKSSKEAELGRSLTGEEASQIEGQFPRQIADLRHKTEGSLGFSVQGLVDKWDEYRGQGVLRVVIPSKTISGKKIEREGLVTSRIDKADNKLSVAEEILYLEYMFKHFGYFENTKADTKLDYEMEYILSGHLSDEDNLRAFAEKLLVFRMGSNYMYIKKDITKQAQLQTTAAALAGLIMAPEAQNIIYNTLQGIWVYAESINDLKIIFDGGKVPLYKSYDDWKLTLTNAYKGMSGSTSGSGKGIDYKGYLRMMLIWGVSNNAPRSMDLVEKNLNLKLDNCIYSFTASFGFVDDRKHSYVFSRQRCYE